jgi:glycosyltransferase involved in cell wall biosynthesis
MPSTAVNESVVPGSGNAPGQASGKAEPTRPLRILHVIDSGGMYGAEKALLGLALECRNLGHEVCVGTIVSPQDNADALGDAAMAAGLDQVQFHMRDGLNLRGLRRILKYAREQRMDVIHSHGYKANVLLALTPRRARPCAMICTLHGWTSAGGMSRMAFYEWLERRLVGAFDRIAVVSNAIKARVRGSHDRVFLVPNGVSSSDHLVPHGSGARSTSRNEPVNILAAGRLSHEKGFDVLIGAVELLKAREIAVQLTIAGEGPQRPELEGQIRDAGLAGAVRLAGYAGDMDRLYDEADMFVLCSRTEGLPMVLLEAMSRGVPVIATAVGEVPEVLGHGRCGRLIGHADPAALADAIQALVSEPHVRVSAMIAAAAEQVRGSYSAATMATAYCSAYNECAHGR